MYSSAGAVLPRLTHMPVLAYLRGQSQKKSLLRIGLAISCQAKPLSLLLITLAFKARDHAKCMTPFPPYPLLAPGSISQC